MACVVAQTLSGVCVSWRNQSCYDHRQSAELRSAWTGEGARPHTSLYAAPKRTDTSFDTPGSCMVTP